MSVETGIPPDVVADLDSWWLDALVAVLRAKAKAMSGDEEPEEASLDWDAMNPDTED